MQYMNIGLRQQNEGLREQNEALQQMLAAALEKLADNRSMLEDAAAKQSEAVMQAVLNTWEVARDTAIASIRESSGSAGSSGGTAAATPAQEILSETVVDLVGDMQLAQDLFCGAVTPP